MNKASFLLTNKTQGSIYGSNHVTSVDQHKNSTESPERINTLVQELASTQENYRKEY